jgi:hypothetical protein
MKLGLTIGKWGLILFIWLFIVLTLSDTIDEMTLIKFSIGLFYTIVIITVGFAIFNFAENPKSGIKFVISFLLLGLILLIGYNMSSDSYDPKTKELIEGSKFTEGGIYTFYTVTIIAVVTIFASEIKRALKL